MHLDRIRYKITRCIVNVLVINKFYSSQHGLIWQRNRSSNFWISSFCSGNTIAGGIAIKYTDSTGGVNVVRMMVDAGGNRKPGQIWIASMQKVRIGENLMYTTGLKNNWHSQNPRLWLTYTVQTLNNTVYALYGNCTVLLTLYTTEHRSLYIHTDSHCTALNNTVERVLICTVQTEQHCTGAQLSLTCDGLVPVHTHYCKLTFFVSSLFHVLLLSAIMWFAMTDISQSNFK